MKEKLNITILLTIFNRVDYTNKWLDFAEKTKVPFKILYQMVEMYLVFKKKLNLKKRKLKITYKKFKYYKNYNHFYEKFYESVKKIDTNIFLLLMMMIIFLRIQS